MNRITAEIVADSLSPQGHRLTTFVLEFPRIVLAEFNTHRMLSRNSASSRAIPFETMMKRVQEEPFIPIAFQKDHKGMQGTEYLEHGSKEHEFAVQNWLTARNAACAEASFLNKKCGVTKQLCNRLLEPFMYHRVIVTASEWENFFALRADPAAEIHIADLAEKMLKEYNESTPKQLEAGEWHIPFGDQVYCTDQFLKLSNDFSSTEAQELVIKIATARCARVSYLNFEGKDDYNADIKLHDRLAEMGHWSPMEHCARVLTSEEYEKSVRTELKNGIFVTEHGWCRNFRGFMQYRASFEHENRKDDRVLKK